MNVEAKRKLDSERERERRKNPACRAAHAKANREYMARVRKNNPEKLKKWRERSILYSSWADMLRRCGQKGTPTKKESINYAGRGVKVCDEWLDYKAFKSWAFSHGYKRGLFIDRVDNEKGYSPENCRYVTRKVNNRNTRATLYVVFKGKRVKFVEAWEAYHHPTVSYAVARGRLVDGWKAEDAILKEKGGR